jgi:hypothetical protein
MLDHVSQQQRSEDFGDQPISKTCHHPALDSVLADLAVTNNLASAR